ncbi:UNVERIFIED_CONTAM: DegV family protein [Campylobacter lari]
MKYAIVVDSSCGLTKEQAEKLGLFYLPLFIDIDNQLYADGIEITPKTLFEKFNLNSEVKTSMFNLAQAHELFENLSKTYDEIIVYPISKYLSNSYSALMSIKKEEFPKLRIIESIEVASLIALDVIWLKEQLETDPSKIDEYIKFIEEGGFNKSISLVPKHNKYLVKGGRLHPAAALIAKMFNIVPIIKFENGQLLKEGIGRNFCKTVTKVITDKSQNFSFDNKKFVPHIILLSSQANEDELKKYTEQIKEEFNIDPVISDIPSVVSIHTGPEAISIIVTEGTKSTIDLFANIIK